MVLHINQLTSRRPYLLADYVIDLRQDALEGQLDVGALQGAGLDEAEPLLLAELLRVLRRDAPQMPEERDTSCQCSPLSLKMTATQPTMPCKGGEVDFPEAQGRCEQG